MDNLRIFNSTADYSGATLSRPAVSLISTTGEIKFDPDIFNGIVRVYYNISDATQEVVLFNGGGSGSESASESASQSGGGAAAPTAIWIDGVAQTAITSTYRFSSNGLHYADFDFDGAVAIPGGMWFDNPLVVKAVVKENVDNIGGQAFNHCANLSVLIIKAAIPPSLDNGAEFIGTSENLVIYVPAASVNTYKTNLPWSHYSNNIQAM